MKLEVGKRYVTREGHVTGPMELTDDLNHPFSAKVSHALYRSWTEAGRWLNMKDDKPLDIVSEYVEPRPQQPLRWVECKPDRVGLWAYRVGKSAHSYVDFCTDDEVQSAANGFSWCYLGPIPEILPPLKKVVERLWISHAKQTAQDAAEYLEYWLPCDEQLIGEGDWIRTDRTREREI